MNQPEKDAAANVMGWIVLVAIVILPTVIFFAWVWVGWLIRPF
jgi:hypothetical protein